MQNVPTGAAHIKVTLETLIVSYELRTDAQEIAVLRAAAAVIAVVSLPQVIDGTRHCQVCGRRLEKHAKCESPACELAKYDAACEGNNPGDQT